MTELIYNFEPGAQARQARLNRILAAVQSFILHCEEAADQGQRLDRFNNALLALEDVKGELKVVWKSETDLNEFSELIDLAWRYQLEASQPKHMVTYDPML